MKTFISFCLVAMSLTGCASAPPHTSSHTSMMQVPREPACAFPNTTVETAVVRVMSITTIYEFDGHQNLATEVRSDGSGVVVAPNTVMTNYHVLDEAETWVQFANITRQADIIAFDAAEDIALLRVNTGHIQPIPLSDRASMIGDAVWSASYPLANELMVSLGKVSSINDRKLYSTTHADSGSSGGALLSCRAGQFELTGLVRAFLEFRKGDATKIVANKSVAINLPVLKEKLKNNAHRVAIQQP